MSTRKRTDISERLLQTLQEIEASDCNSNSDVNGTVVPEMDSIFHPLISHHNGIADEQGENAVFQNSDNNINFADQSFNCVVQNKLATNKLELLGETSGRKDRFSTVSRNFKSKISNLDDGHDDCGGSGSGLSSVARQLEHIHESQDAILADIRMDMEQLHMDNLALRQNSAKLLAERNHYEKLYDEVSKNLQMIKEHIRQIQSSPNPIVDVQLGETIEPHHHETNSNFCNNKTLSFCELSLSSQLFLKDSGRTDHYQELLDQYNFTNNVPSPATKPEITKNYANHGLSGITNYEPALELEQQNRLAQEKSVVQVQEGTRKNGSDKPLSQYINVRNATLSTTTLNSLKGETHTRKQLLSYSQTSEISQTESTLTRLSGQSVTRLDSNNSSDSSNASTTESILQVRSISNKTSKKGKISKVKTGCFEFLRRRRKNKKPKLAIETNL